MTKTELRKHYLTLRKNLSLNEVAHGNASIIDQLKQQLDFSSIKILHLFLPIAHQNEVDLWPFIQWIWKQHPSIQIVVPKCDFKTVEMASCLLTPTTELTTENFGIPEPTNPKQIENSLIDTVITPLVVCDKQGYRVGYGKGFYDAFFKKCKPSIQKLGVGFFPPVDQIDGIDEWDEPLDHYIFPI